MARSVNVLGATVSCWRGTGHAKGHICKAGCRNDPTTKTGEKYEHKAFL